MYTDFREINALYHHGIKGQKWGVINKKDDSPSRVTSEKNRLDYDAKIARYQGELEAVKQNNATDLKIAKEETKRTVLEGKAKVHEALVQANADKTKAKAERDAKFKKYAMIGAAIAGVLWASRKAMNVTRDVMGEKYKSNLLGKAVDNNKSSSYIKDLGGSFKILRGNRY